VNTHHGFFNFSFFNLRSTSIQSFTDAGRPNITRLLVGRRERRKGYETYLIVILSGVMGTPLPTTGAYHSSQNIICNLPIV
jgi:hypothetical protein